MEVSDEKAPKPLIEDESKSGKSELELEFDREMEQARVAVSSMNPDGIKGKKFTILTRWDISADASNPVRPGQFFKIKLDDKLKTQQEDLPDLSYKGYGVIATPKYNKNDNTITYTLNQTISSKISVPIRIDVDYNRANIDPKAKQFVIENSVSGLGVVDPKPLLPVAVDSNGNMLSTIVEPNRKDVVQILDYGDDYRVNIKAFGVPEVENKEITKINWKVLVKSNVDLDKLGYAMNFTAVEGSGLKEIQGLKAVSSENKELMPGESYETNAIADPRSKGLGIVDSKHHTLKATGTKELLYTFSTEVSEKQASYMLDLSAVLKNKKKVGATRLILTDGYDQGRIEEATPTRVGMNNRTTIMGKFTSEKTAQWTVTDAVSTGDEIDGLPWASRKLSENQKEPSGQAAVYKLDIDSGKMVLANPLSPQHPIEALPEKGKDPDGKQPVGTIAVYQINTKLENWDKPERYSIDGLFISKYQDLRVFQEWNLADRASIPAENFFVNDENGNPIGDAHFEPSVRKGNEREFTIPGIKQWTIGEDGTATAIIPTIKQEWVKNQYDPYTYWENQNFYRPDKKYFYMHNSAVDDQKARGSFSLLKIDGKDKEKNLQGAEYTLMGRGLWEDQENGELKAVTDKNGKITFRNIPEGTYTLVENKAPEGYKLDLGKKFITIDRRGRVSVSGPNASLSGGAGTTQRDQDANWPKYMNTMHYGKIENNRLTFYLYLKPESGDTNKDTRLNLRVNGVDKNNLRVAVYDVHPSWREYVRQNMDDQTAEEVDRRLTNVLTTYRYGPTWDISGRAIDSDPYTQKDGFQIKFPVGRFTNDWSFLVKVTAPVDNATKATLHYDWLTDKSTATEAKIQQDTILNKVEEGDKNMPLITMTNEAFEKQPIAMTKVGEDGKGLAGAVIALKDSTGNTLRTIETAKDGEAKFGTYSPGTYTLEEIKAPDKHMVTNVIFEVTVGKDGKVTYRAKYKNSAGKPLPGVDYVIDTEENNETTGNSVNFVSQELLYDENEPGDIGVKTGVWEAYRFESLKYKAKISLGTYGKGESFTIQFDKNLDFTQYVKEFPKAKDKNKNIIADPYFDFNTNRLTYVFRSGADATDIELEIKGIIPSKYYAKENGVTFYTINVPGAKTIDKEQFEVKSDYGYYDSDGKSPSQSYYFKDIYTDDNNDTYVTALAYYNPFADYRGGSRTLRFNWLTTDYGGGATNIVSWPARGYRPAFELQDVKIYKTYPVIHREGEFKYNQNMPLSYGVRPEQDPLTYSLAYQATIPNANSEVDNSQNGFRLRYDPKQIQTSGTINQKSPLQITMPGISRANEGYLIEQTFKVVNEDTWKNKWRAFYMSNGDLKSGFANKPVSGDATVNQTGREIPKSYKEVVKLINKSYTPGKFRIHKMDAATGATLESGAYFTLYDAKGKAVAEKTSTSKMEKDENTGADKLSISPIEFADLEPGNYTLKETKAPPKHLLSNKTWQVNVDANGVVTIVEQSIDGSASSVTGTDIYYRITNNPSGGEFRVFKKSDKGDPLEGAEFKITKLDEKNRPTGPSGIGTTNDKGQINEFKDSNNTTYVLAHGSYLLEETKAPEGYQKTNKQWVVKIDDKGTNVYDYVNVDTKKEKLQGHLTQEGTYWVDVGNRDLTGWALDDHRQSGYADYHRDPYKLGTRIIAINEKEGYVIQRYVINPEKKQLGKKLTAYIHREKPWYKNMDWYAGTEVINVFTLDKPVTENVEDIRLANYKETEILNPKARLKGEQVTMSGDQRLKLDLSDYNNVPIIIDVKVPYKNRYGGVGTGMDLYNETDSGAMDITWKSDFYESVAIIKKGDPTTSSGAGNIYGSFVSRGSLEVVNEPSRYKFTLKKVKSGEKKDPIKGASFTLKGPKSNDPNPPEIPERTLFTGADGRITFDNLLPGEYNLVEKSSAPGYKKVDTTWTVIVNSDGTVTMTDNNSSPEVTAPAKWGIADDDNAPANQMNRSLMLNSFLAPFGEASAPFSVKAPIAEENGDAEAKERAKAQEAPIAKVEDEQAAAKNTLVAEGEAAETKQSTEAAPSATAEKKDAAKTAAPQAVNEQEAAAIGEAASMEAKAGEPLADQISRTAVLDNFLTTFGANSGLELGEEIVPSPVGAGWEKVDLNRSESRTTRNGAPNEIQTRITEINKAEGKYKQVFLVNLAGDSMQEAKFDFHAEPLQSSVVGEPRGRFREPVNFKVLSIRPIRPSSTLDNIQYEEPKDIGFKAAENYRITPEILRYRMQLKENSYSKPIAIEVEYTYPKSGAIGLGMNFKRSYLVTDDNRPWAAESYASVDDINCKYYVKTQTVGNGTVTLDKQNPVKKGDQVPLTVKPNDGHKLKSLVVDNKDVTTSVQGDKYTFTMPEHDVNVTATFEQDAPPQPTKHKIDIRMSAGGDVTAKTASGANLEEVANGERVALTVKPDNGHKLKSLVVDNQDVTASVQGNKYTFTMPDHDVNVIATFAPIEVQGYRVRVADTIEGGTVNADPSTGLKKGDVVTLTATPNSGFEFVKFIVKDKNGDPVEVLKEQPTPAAQAQAGPVAMTPVGGVPGSEIEYFIMPDSDVTVTAVFKPLEYNIKTVTVPNDGGSITLDRWSHLQKGDTVKVKVEVDNGYKLTGWQVFDAEGTTPLTEISTATEGQFEMPASHITVKATFEKESSSNKEVTIGKNQLALIENEQKGLGLKIYKKNFDGKVLPDATFTLEELDKDENVVKNTLVTAKSDENGVVVFKDGDKEVLLKEGQYRLTEIVSPSGYKKPPAPWKIVVEEGKDGQMKAKYYGPEKTPTTFVNSNAGKIAGLEKEEQGQYTLDAKGIKYASRTTYINPTATTTTLGKEKNGVYTDLNIPSQVGTYVQRLYVDTRGYTGSDKVNVQIEPKNKRDEYDTPSVSPFVLTQGVKTAYYTVYKLDEAPSNEKLDEAISTYDLSKPGVKMIKTARWRPFDWGFDEDQLNLDAGHEKGGVYFIDVEGFYDQDIVDKNKGIALDFKFYNGAREFQQFDGYDKYGKPIWKAFKDASYLGGNVAAKLTADSTEGKKQRGKYQRWLGKENGRIWPSLEGEPQTTVSTKIDISPLYTSDTDNEIPQKGMTILNEEETYNITFSKHGVDGQGDDWKFDGKKVAENRLEGAVFKLQKLVAGDYEDIQGSYVASAFNGYFGFRGLKPGRYRLIEVKPPEGYKAIKGTILEMTISHTGDVVDGKTGKITPGKGLITFEYGKGQGIIQYLPDSKETNKDGKLVDYVTAATAKNMGKVLNDKPGKGKVRVKKFDDSNPKKPLGSTMVDGKGNPIKDPTPVKPGDDIDYINGAEFELFRLSKSGTDSYSKTYKINEKGEVLIDELPIGNYRLVEKTPHPGHKNLGQEWNFTVGGMGLDPYAGEKLEPDKGTDLTKEIYFESYPKISVRQYMGEHNQSENTIYPHKAESIEIQSKFTVNKDIKIKKNDHFTVKLSDKIDLAGIYKDRIIGNLDIFADGVGTIAKGEYNKKDNTITYTFTGYADKYTLLDFGTTLAAWINLDKVTYSDWVVAGIGLGGKNMEDSQLQGKKDLYVNYNIPGETSSHWTSDNYNSGNLNITGKIYEMNPNNGHFVQYYYINRQQISGILPATFRYSSTKDLQDVDISIKRFYGYSQNALHYYYMPESFAIPAEVDNMEAIYKEHKNALNVGDALSYTFGYNNYNTMTRQDSYLVKITGTIKPEKVKELGSQEETEKGAKGFETAGLLNRSGYTIAGRYDQAYFTENQTTATAELPIIAINPENKIRFKKVDIKGNPIDGAIFGLRKSPDGKQSYGAVSDQLNQISGKRRFKNESGNIDTSKLAPGEFEFNKLTEGYYELVELGAEKNSDAEKFVKNGETLLRFKVDHEGKVWREVARNEQGEPEYVEETGEIPVPVVNHKPIEIHKIDGHDKETFLPGAKFKVYYKGPGEKKYDILKIPEEDDKGNVKRGADGKILYKDYPEVAVGEKAPNLGKLKLHLYKAGDYALEETKVPKDYTKPPKKFVKEFRLDDNGLFVKEKGLAGNIPKQDDATDVDTSFVMAVMAKKNAPNQAQSDALAIYVVINPTHDARTYGAKDNVLLQYKDLYFNRGVTAYRIDENGHKSKEEELAVSWTKDNEPKANLFIAAGGKSGTSIESKDTIVLKFTAVPSAIEDKDAQNGGQQATQLKEVLVKTIVSIHDEKNHDEIKKEATYKIEPDKLKDASKFIETFEKHPTLEKKPDKYGKDDKVTADYDKKIAEYKSAHETYTDNYRKDFYVKYESEDKPVDVLNYKGVYPFTGGFGPHRWIVIIGAVIAAVAAEEYIRRKRSSAPKGGA